MSSDATPRDQGWRATARREGGQVRPGLDSSRPDDGLAPRRADAARAVLSCTAVVKAPLLDRSGKGPRRGNLVHGPTRLPARMRASRAPRRLPFGLSPAVRWPAMDGHLHMGHGRTLAGQPDPGVPREHAQMSRDLDRAHAGEHRGFRQLRRRAGINQPLICVEHAVEPRADRWRDRLSRSPRRAHRRRSQARHRPPPRPAGFAPR